MTDSEVYADPLEDQVLRPPPAGGTVRSPEADPPVPAIAGVAPRPAIRSRYRDRDFALRRALLIADLLGLWLALAAALVLVGSRSHPLPESLWILPTLPFWAFLFRTYLLYRRPIRRFEPTHLDDISALFHALLVGTLGLWLFYKVAPVRQLEFAEILMFGLLSLPLIAALRVVLRMVNLRLQGPERVFAVAPIDDVSMLQRKLRNHPEYEMTLVGAVAPKAGDEEHGLAMSSELDEVEALLAEGEIDHLVVRLDATYISQVHLHDLMRACHREGVRFGCFPTVKSLFHPGVEVNHIEGMGILTSNPPVLSRTALAMKRGLDVAMSSVLIVLFAPLMALIAFAIRIDSPGPVFFRQVRVGKEGRRFKLIKFRTMVPGADELAGDLMDQSTDPDWLVLKEDPRVTRVGRFLRLRSLDELPQLWNVLTGEMSLVGPRPLPERDDRAVKGWGRHRLDLTPGVTGYWQVLGRNNIPFQEMVELDYAYVASWSMLHDVKLLIRTIPVVLLRRGAN